MIKSCLNCINHGPPISLATPKNRPCKECIPHHGFTMWELTDKELIEDSK